MATSRRHGNGSNSAAWACSVCTFSNQPDSGRCEMCGANAKREYVATPHQEQSDVGTWTCAVCTFSNRPNSKRCAICGPPWTKRKQKSKEKNKNGPAEPSQRFYQICKKCKNEDTKEERVVALLQAMIEECGVDAIDINYRNHRSHDFALKYILKYAKPKVFQFVVDAFADKIDFFMMDNMCVRNNVLHYMVQEMGRCDEANANLCVDILFDKDNELGGLGLLYQYNDYQDTPIAYCRKRKFVGLSRKLETIKYVHLHDLLVAHCSIPYVIAHCIIGYVFVVVHATNLDRFKHKWDVLIIPQAAK